ncbi:MAG: beta-propeller domain-containing protein [Candidatus Uhrbacteria bacterium]
MKKEILFALASIMIMLAIGLWVLAYFSLKYEQNLIPDIPDIFENVTDVIVGQGEVAKFESAEDFKQYLAEVRSTYMDSYGFGGFVETSQFRGGDVMVLAEEATAVDSSGLNEVSGMGAGAAPTADRVSETNVQVQGIDEPDIVKTDGQEIYYSQEEIYYYWRETRGFDTTTKMISALPVEEMDIDGEIEAIGDLLLVDDILLILDYQGINAYDVSDPTSAVELWTMEYSDSTYHDARLYNGLLYLVTYTWISDYNPCPIEPFYMADQPFEIACSDIYHPVAPAPSDVTFNVAKINPTSGQIEDQVSLVSSYSEAVVYMTTGNLYLTYTYPESFVNLVVEFFNEEAYNLVSTEALQRIRNLEVYEISDQAKMVEFQVILDDYLNSLDEDDRLMFENEFENRMDTFLDERKRELTRTGIVRIDPDNLSIKATGEVPGYPLNQFSLDEWDDHLRIATTVGGSGLWGWMFSSSTESENDLYVLNDNLKVTGQVQGLAEGERIYSARFIEDKGYLVTFRQTDPFYVFDLSNHKKPAMVGELKIPGYSSYLHPLAEDLILGVGMEDSKVKLSLFDVSDPTDPVEVSKYMLDEYWSDVLETHHAFLHDSKFGVFFMPGSQGGYIFSYEDDNLQLEKAVAGINAKRAIYVNDNLYIFGQDEIVVLDENTWERVGELDL